MNHWNRTIFSLFVVLTVLYYFLRFQSGFPQVFALMQALVFLSLAISGMFVIAYDGVVRNRYKLDTEVGIVIFLLLIQGILFTAIASYLGGMNGVYWASITHVLPFLLFFYVVFRFRLEDVNFIFKVLEITLLTVTVIYIAEFSSVMLIKQGFFQYSTELREHAINMSGSPTSRSWVQGDLYRLIRMAGPLSHNNTTGLAIAIGFVIAVANYVESKRLWVLLLTVFYFGVLVLTGARTAILAGILGSIAVVLTSGLNTKLFVRMIFGLFFMFVLMMVLMTFGVMDMSAFGKVFSWHEMWRTVMIIFSHHKIEHFAYQVLYNPLILITGVGAAIPGVVMESVFYPVKSDDIFIVSLLSRFGLVLPMLLVIGVYLKIRRLKKAIAINRNLPSVRGVAHRVTAISGIAVAFIASTVHTNALLRPQLFPVLLISIAVLVIIDSYMKKINRLRFDGCISPSK